MSKGGVSSASKGLLDINPEGVLLAYQTDGCSSNVQEGVQYDIPEGPPEDVPWGVPQCVQ